MNLRHTTVALVAGLLGLAACGNDEPAEVRPPPTSANVVAELASGRAIVTGDDQPIVAADAYHGAGFVICPDGTQPTNIADGYHGVGVTVCL